MLVESRVLRFARLLHVQELRRQPDGGRDGQLHRFARRRRVHGVRQQVQLHPVV